MSESAAPSPASAEAPRIDQSWSVNEVIVMHPATVSVFNSFGIDTCCGGSEPIGLAAQEIGIDLPTLLGALEAAAR